MANKIYDIYRSIISNPEVFALGREFGSSDMIKR
jgi:hypothetical protein